MKELLEARRADIDAARHAALEKLQLALDVAQERQEELDETQRSYQDNFRDHLSASKSRQVAHDQLQQLLAQKIDFVGPLPLSWPAARLIYSIRTASNRS